MGATIVEMSDVNIPIWHRIVIPIHAIPPDGMIPSRRIYPGK